MKNKTILVYGFWISILVWFAMSIMLAFLKDADFKLFDVLIIGAVFAALVNYHKNQVNYVDWYKDGLFLFLNVGLLLIGIFQMDIQWRLGILTSTIEFSLDTLQGTALCSTELVFIFAWILGKLFGERSNH